MKKSKKKNKEDSSIGAIVLGIVFMLLILLVFFFRDKLFRNERYKEELKKKINEKEQCIFKLKNELAKMKELHELFRNEAILFFKALKITVIIIMLGLVVVCFAIFSFSFFGTLTTIVTVVAFVYNAVTIVMQNKVGDFNATLVILEQYFIERTFRKNAFEPAVITIIEEKLNSEQYELEVLKTEFIRVSNTDKFTCMD